MFNIAPLHSYTKRQKQFLQSVLYIKRAENVRKIHGKTPTITLCFNKIANNFELKLVLQSDITLKKIFSKLL